MILCESYRRCNNSKSKFVFKHLRAKYNTFFPLLLFSVVDLIKVAAYKSATISCLLWPEVGLIRGVDVNKRNVTTLSYSLL